MRIIDRLFESRMRSYRWVPPTGPRGCCGTTAARCRAGADFDFKAKEAGDGLASTALRDVGPFAKGGQAHPLRRVVGRADRRFGDEASEHLGEWGLVRGGLLGGTVHRRVIRQGAAIGMPVRKISILASEGFRRKDGVLVVPIAHLKGPYRCPVVARWSALWAC